MFFSRQWSSCDPAIRVCSVHPVRSSWMWRLPFSFCQFCQSVNPFGWTTALSCYLSLLTKFKKCLSFDLSVCNFFWFRFATRIGLLQVLCFSDCNLDCEMLRLLAAGLTQSTPSGWPRETVVRGVWQIFKTLCIWLLVWRKMSGAWDVIYDSDSFSNCIFCGMPSSTLRSECFLHVFFKCSLFWSLRSYWHEVPHMKKKTSRYFTYTTIGRFIKEIHDLRVFFKYVFHWSYWFQIQIVYSIQSRFVLF